MISGRRLGASTAGNGSAQNGGSRSNASNGGSRRGAGGGLGTGGGGRGGGGGAGAAWAAERLQFHPKLITAQIISMQCIHYFLLAFLFQLNALFFRTSITIDRIFTDRYVRLWHRSGWPDVWAILMASLAGSVLLAVIVEKSKKCLDFGVTLFLIHWMVCWMYNGFPTVLDWWIVHLLGMIVMVLLGEYLCSRRELDDIPLLQI